MTDHDGMRRGLVGVGLLLGVALAGGAWWLARRPGIGAGTAAAWAAVSGVGVCALVWTTWRRREANRPQSEGDAAGRAHDGLGLANGVTLVRGGALAGLGGLLVVPTPPAWAAAALYGCAAALDAVDGAVDGVARYFDRETRLGADLDGSFDGAGLLVAGAVGVTSGALPAWYLLAGLVRYAFIAGKRLRRRRGRSLSELPPSRSRRVLAGLQMAMLPVALAPPTPRPVGWAVATVVLVPFLVNFWLDWRVVSGKRETALP